MTELRTSRVCLWLLALGLIAFVPAALAPTASFAEEKPEGGGEEGAGDEDEVGVDLGDQNVSFQKRIDEAIDKGVTWLKNCPDVFEIEKRTDAAHWGLVRGSTVYGGGQGHQYQHPAGPTALAIYTLLKCDVDPEDEVIENGFNWLRERHEVTQKYDAVPQGFPPNHKWTHIEKCSSYELSAMILALTAKYDKYKKSSASKSAKRKGKLKIRNGKDRKWLQELVQTLVERRGVPEPGARTDQLGWRYNTPSQSVGTFRMNSTNPPHANQDLSSTQLATLALYSANRFGVDVDLSIWVDIINFTLDHQEEKGPEHERYDKVFKDGGYTAPMDHARGFMYIKGSPDHSEGKATSSMTACGLCNLLLAYDVLNNDKSGKKLMGEMKLGSKIDTAVWDAIAWLDRNWSPFENKYSHTGYHIYYLYALERAMDVLEKSLCGSHVWYEEGAKEILNYAQSDTIEVKVKKLTELHEVFFWKTNATHEPQDVLDTCFALLFLKRATKGLVPGGVVTGS